MQSLKDLRKVCIAPAIPGQKSSRAALFLNLLSDIKITSGQYLCISVPVRINFASVRYFQRQEGRQCVPAMHSTSADSAPTAAQASLLLQSAFQAKTVKSLRHILYPALSPSSISFPQFLMQAVVKRPQALSERRHKLQFGKHCNQN